MSQRPVHRQALAWMRGDYIVNSERWTSDVLEWPVRLDDVPQAAAYNQFVRAFAAARRGESHTVFGPLWMEMSRLQEAIRDTLMMRAMTVLNRELEGLVLLARGDTVGGLRQLRDAAHREDDLPVDFGPPQIVKPSHELLGDVLLELNRPQEAQHEYTLALRAAPGRARSLIGLVRSAAAAGDRAVAESAYRELAANWAAADPDLPELRSLRPLIASR